MSPDLGLRYPNSRVSAPTPATSFPSAWIWAIVLPAGIWPGGGSAPSGARLRSGALASHAGSGDGAVVEAPPPPPPSVVGLEANGSSLVVPQAATSRLATRAGARSSQRTERRAGGAVIGTR